MRRLTFIFLVLSLIFGSGCRKYKSDAGERASLLKSPSVVLIDTLEIKAVGIELSREFNPPFTINGKRMTAEISLIETHDYNISDRIEPLRLFVIKDDEMWETTFETILYQGRQILCYAEKGPKWDPGKYVHVVISFLGPEGVQYILTKNVLIQKED